MGRLAIGRIGTVDTAELVIARNTMARTCGIHLPAIPPLLHYVQQQETLF